MVKRILAFALVLGLTLTVSPDAFAGKGGGGGGGRSFSSGGSRPSFSGSRPSFSGGSKPSFSGGSKPSYSSGSSSSYSGSRPSYSSGSSPSSSSRPTYSSGGSPTVAPKPSASGGYKPGTSTYSSGGRTYTPVAAPDAGSRPKGGAFDGSAAAAQKRVESKAAYVKGADPRPSYTTPTGKTVNIDQSSRSVQTIRNMDTHVYVNREVRITTVYAPYYNPTLYPVVVYNDPFNTFFWYWLLDQSLERRAMWAYHHKAEMDEARYRALLAKDAKLEARIKQLEAEKRAVDPTYVPPGIDYDLQYTDDYVDSIVNPHTAHKSGGWVGAFFFWAFMVTLGIVVVWLVVYLVFVRRW